MTSAARITAHPPAVPIAAALYGQAISETAADGRAHVLVPARFRDLPQEHGGRDVDVGFLVYNENTYPNLIGMLEELGVDTEPSDMSFAVSLASRTFEWSSRGLSALFATRSNLVSPAFHSMLADLLRFSRFVACDRGVRRPPPPHRVSFLPHHPALPAARAPPSWRPARRMRRRPP